ncbi:hypothetical protein [Jiulongibacter sediminis]|uniref:hypothetical protein n=1 Tax=Jiulongibacter sediminis TaxID=1605367 RepID=UPI0026EE9F6E|nr:hypothetical protein [Jiulongibacter sediminis]
MILNAVYLDFKGKQNYIFSSNKLRTHIGASAIIEKEALGSVLIDLLRKTEPLLNVSDWYRSAEIIIHPDKCLSIGFIGGGNALLFFRETENAQVFIADYSLLLTSKYPGLQFVCTLLDDFDASDTGFEESRKRLHRETKISEKLYIGRRGFKKWGYEKQCALSSGPANVYNKTVKSWVSAELDSKIQASGKLTLKEILSSNDYLTEKFELSNEIDNLNADEEKGYIAVIHLDGNGLGKKFREETGNLKKLRDLSYKTNSQLETALASLLEMVCNDFNKEVFNIDLPRKNNKKILPIRPIINAGDDITIVCHGSLGLRYTIEYMNLLAKDGLFTCAGVLVCKKHQPLHMAYEFAEKLAAKAKEKSRKWPNTAWLSYCITPDMLGDHIFEYFINDKQEQVSTIPYQVLDGNSEDFKSEFDLMLEKAIKLSEYPKGKLYQAKMGFLDTYKQDAIRAELITIFKNDPLKQTQSFFEDYSYDAFEILDFYALHKSEHQ